MYQLAVIFIYLFFFQISFIERIISNHRKYVFNYQRFYAITINQGLLVGFF